MLLLGHIGLAASVSAQALEVAPSGGYGFGGDVFQRLTARPLDVNGAPAVGVVVDISTGEGYQMEALYVHQRFDAVLPGSPGDQPLHWHLAVDRWQAGGLQEFERGPVRPFLVGSLGLTRYAAHTENDIRFTLSAGGGVKLFPASHVGVRLTGQAFATFANGNGTAFFCAPGVCAIALGAGIVWEAAFTAGLIVRFR
jgi:hypothetical protein